MISWIKDSLMNDESMIDFKTLESYRGFLIYISRTYPSITPYLKGIHLTLDSWRLWRDDEAWKLPLSEIRVAQEARGKSISLGEESNASGKPPPKSQGSP
jgi:hypothetical protein